ncbi:MAG: hypothetical protein NTY06_02980 [Candidatus Gottesmanbacteria bacterium]|nr:hypothetical protein [Candidatus Gottesmanbacteria bacterium]
MKNVLLPLLAFLLGFSGVVGYQYIRTKQNTPVVATPESTFTLMPPSQAVSGILTVTSGHAEKLSRTDTEYKEASTGAQILLGESVATKENSSATATVSGIVKVSMGPSAELVFANLFPTNFVLQQKSGNIDYLVTKPISVRTLHSLVTIDSGETIITIIDTDISITVKTGSVKFALVDTENNTKVWNLKAGQRANIDDKARKVYLVGQR